jgi:catechol 2,3-dioxygenase-like lactoylglutathione lyase family enzyme
MTTNEGGRPVIELRVAITTADFERLKRFYCDGLGLEPTEIWTSADDSALLLELGRGTMEILDEPHAAKVDDLEAGRRVSGHIRFALQVPDLQAALDRLLAKGAKLVHPPVVTPWRHHNVRLEDPDGLQVTLFQVLPPA